MSQKLLSGLLMAAVISVISGCGPARGHKLVFNGGDLYYKPPVTLQEATKLGDYLVRSGVFDGEEKTTQIAKTGSTYEFRVVVKRGLENDQEWLNTCKFFARDLSHYVFDGNKVDMHLCDEQLKTIRVVMAY